MAGRAGRTGNGDGDESGSGEGGGDGDGDGDGDGGGSGGGSGGSGGGGRRGASGDIGSSDVNMKRMSRAALEKQLKANAQGRSKPNDNRTSADIVKRAREAASRAVASRAQSIEMTEMDEAAYSRLYAMVANEVRNPSLRLHDASPEMNCR